jgi:hypothetical protein
MQVRTALCLLLALFSAVAFAAGEVYRTVDVNGNVVYSDRPLNERSELVRVSTGAPASSARAANAGSSSAAGRVAAGSDPTDDIQAPAPPAPLPDGPTAAEMREQRVKNCEIARERQERYAISRRLYRETESGEREYVSDPEIEDARSRAAVDVQNWCG